MENETVVETKPLPVPESIGWRFFYGIVVTVLAFLCFIAVNILKPEYQTGKFTDYVSLFLAVESSWVFLPLIAYSSVCLLLLFLSPQQYAKSFWVRLGIYTGALLAFQYLVLTFLALLETFYIILAVWIASIVIVPLYRFLTKLMGVKLFFLIFVILPTLAYCFLFLLISIFPEIQLPFIGSEFTFPFFFLAAFLLACAPFWSFLIMAKTSYLLLKHYEPGITLPGGAGILAWFGGFTGAWIFSVLKTMEIYAALPPQPPDCYIATAAAKGHPQVVRSQPVRLADGTLMQVNPQLQRLKCVELALLVTSPQVHKFIRRIYDVLGRKLAAQIKNPILADIAFLILIPVEWVSFLVLKSIIPNVQSISKKMYHS
ncbi:MAG: hypothetical protein IPO22_14250 [Anaerolineales bacterium]|nr:hypothetical protein [Anaerolineales bacterium]